MRKKFLFLKKNADILVQIKAVGICGSDLHYFLEGGMGSFKEKLPMSMGHEPAGIVVDNNGSQWFSNGDRVAIEPGLACRHCLYCLRGQHNLCSRIVFMGAKGAPGAFQEYMIIHESQLLKIDDNLSFEEGALFEPLGVAYHALNLINFRIHSTVAIFGVGPVGLCVLAMVKKAGAGKVFVIDKLDYRLQFARSYYNADYIMNEEIDVVEFIKENTGGLGVNVAFDAAGKQNTVDRCFEVAAPGGKVVLIGIPTYDFLQYNPHKARIKELTVFNVRRSNQALHTCHDIVKRGEINVKNMITHRSKLEDIQKIFEIAGGYKDGVIKAMVIM